MSRLGNFALSTKQQKAVIFHSPEAYENCYFVLGAKQRVNVMSDKQSSIKFSAGFIYW